MFCFISLSSHIAYDIVFGKLHVSAKTIAQGSPFKVAENNFKKSLSFNSCRWHLQVLFKILDLVGINAWILCKQTTGENISRQDFLLILAVELGANFREARDQPKERKNTKGSLPKSTTDAYQRKRCQIGYCKENKTNKFALNVKNMFE
ncbi:uncharacterized protein TNCV_1169581 [Trichonephila clavipes]|uniref:PiggyBac transposable element-derived protein domain-containing protein n=1 Tax=Trichonephila clavipes TaxID=2585209 RepID=A0A8X6VPL0_TRICX|nr:uncharacterized protein TNCV_1169581 [Trichonephila clavipes]